MHWRLLLPGSSRGQNIRKLKKKRTRINSCLRSILATTPHHLRKAPGLLRGRLLPGARLSLLGSFACLSEKPAAVYTVSTIVCGPHSTLSRLPLVYLAARHLNSTSDCGQPTREVRVHTVGGVVRTPSGGGSQQRGIGQQLQGRGRTSFPRSGELNRRGQGRGDGREQPISVKQLLEQKQAADKVCSMLLVQYSPIINSADIFRAHRLPSNLPSLAMPTQALTEAQRKLKEAEEEMSFVQVDCEQMRHVVQVAVQEKAKAQERELEVR